MSSISFGILLSTFAHLLFRKSLSYNRLRGRLIETNLPYILHRYVPRTNLKRYVLYICWTWWHTHIIAVLEKLGQQDEELRVKASSDIIVTSKLGTLHIETLSQATTKTIWVPLHKAGTGENLCWIKYTTFNNIQVLVNEIKDSPLSRQLNSISPSSKVYYSVPLWAKNPGRHGPCSVFTQRCSHISNLIQFLQISSQFPKWSHLS